MKKILLFIFTIGLFSNNYGQSVNLTATLGTLSGSYTTLKAAFDNINNGIHKGSISIALVGNTTETVSAVLNASGSGSASYTDITIQPSGGAARTISGSLSSPLVDLNGADNVTINGLNTNGNSLDISNASTSNVAGTSTIRFRTDATLNLVKNCTIEGSSTGTTNTGTIQFSTGTATGNDGNVISNNTIIPAGGNFPTNAIDSKGTSVAIDNSGITISNNNIQDYYSAINASNGIYIESNSSAWIITGNNFFQTANRTCTATGYVHRAINIITASGFGYTVNNNIIGYSSAAGTGTTIYDGAFANKFIGIEMTTAISASSDIQGNTISGISLTTTSGTSTGTGIFTGISVLAGSINIGTTTANTIGATTGTGAISVTSSASGGLLLGISVSSTGSVSIQNNTIGSISTAGAAAIGFTMSGISTSGASGNFTITGNVVGSTTTANCISVGNSDGSTTASCTFNGIINSSTGTTSITSNTIQNCSVLSSGASNFYGITNSGSTGTLSIDGNSIRSGTNSGTGNFTCISNTAAATSIVITSNIITGHTKTAASGGFIGISNTGAASSDININSNQLGNTNGGVVSFANASTGTVTGIINNAGTGTTTVSINNNTLQGFSVVSSGAFIGISNAGGSGVGININNNQLGNSTTGIFSFSAATSTVTGISNSGGTANTALSIYNNSLAGFSGFSSGTFIGINNSYGAASINITYNQLGISTAGILTFSNASSSAITGISNSGGAAGTATSISNNTLFGFSIVSCTAAFTGISNTGSAGNSITITNNQLGNSTTGILTSISASTGAITGISNNAGTATTTIFINSNSLQGFSVVSSGTFTGIINGGNSTGVAININNNLLGTPSGGLITYSAANATAIIGISNTGGASTAVLSIQTNDLRGIVYSTAGTAANTYIINSAATLSQNISLNTFTNLNINSTGSITFISDNVIVSGSGTQNVDGNAIVGSFIRNSASASGTLTLFTSSASSVPGSVISNSNNNFSNITVSGSATIAGWVNTDAGTGTKSIKNNIFNNWTAGTGLVVAMNLNIGGTDNSISGNTFTNFSSGGNITVITGAGNDNIYLNSINSIASTGTGATLVNGIVCTAGSTINIYQNTITALQANFSNLSGIVLNSLAVNGIFVTGGNLVNVNQNILSGFTADAIDAGTINGVTVSGGSTVNVSQNKIYNLSSNSAAINAGGISGIFVFSTAGSVTNVFNNLIGDFRTPVSPNSDSYRGISINSATSSNINVYYNTIYLNSTSTGANFGCSGIYHVSSANSTIAQLDLRNNIIVNVSTPNGSGLIAAFRQYAVPLNNYAATSNNNLFYVGTPSASRLIFSDFTNADQTVAAFQARLVNRDGHSFSEDLSAKILSFTGTSANFLHIDSTKCTRVESGGVNISGFTNDYDGQVRQGNPGYTGTGTAPDIGADEFNGIATPSAVLSGTQAICNGSPATLSLTVTGTGILSGKLSDSTAFSGTVPTITVNVSPSSATTYTITTLTNGVCYSSPSDKTGSATVTINPRPTGMLSGTQTLCNGGPATLTISATGSGTISGTLSDGTNFSGTAPTITISVSPSSTTTYTIATLSNGTCVSSPGDKTGSATITVVVPPAISYAGNPYCTGSGTASVTLTGINGGVFSSTAGLTINSVNGDITTGTTTPGTYTVTYTVAAAGGCSQYQTTTPITINSTGTWTGSISNDWNTAANWVCNTIPTTSTDAIIPGGLTKYPIINSLTSSVRNINIQSGASLTVTAAVFQISGSIAISGMLDASNGTIEMNGSVAQTIPANAFLNNDLHDLIISNTNASGVILAGPLDIYGSLTYSATGMVFTTNDYLTLKSTLTNTAYVGDMTGNSITGKVTVERYISSRKAWRFLSIPTNTSQTIQQTWQEGATSTGSNPVPGYGIQITGAGGTAAGFDSYSVSPSMKTYNSVTNAWVGVPTTNATGIKATTGYMIFVRGDRTISSPFVSPTQTTLRSKGTLYTGSQAPLTVGATQFTAIGNPYASAIDMRNIIKTGVKDFFYVWDPALSGANGYGGYQTFSNDGSGNYVITPGGGSYGAAASISNYIASGMAFFVQGNATGGSLTFKESAKTNNSGVVSTAQALPPARLLVSLYGVNADNTTYMADGFMVNYNDNYSNKVDDLDAIKSANSSENLSVKNSNSLLVVERRHSIVAQDTIFLNLTGVSVQNYRFEIEADQMYQPGLTGFLEDAYLHTRTPLSIDGVTDYNFPMVNIPGAYAANRFRIVFAPPIVLPVTFTSLKAYAAGKNINVDWHVDNELNIKQYEVEKSADGTAFTTIAITPASANTSHSASYSTTDTKPLPGYNYYRIKSIDNIGAVSYTNIVKILTANEATNFIITPNPIVEGKINLLFNNQPNGLYGIRVLNQLGQPVLSKQINHDEGSSTEIIQLNNYLAHGLYQVEITSPANDVKLIQVSY